MSRSYLPLSGAVRRWWWVVLLMLVFGSWMLVRAFAADVEGWRFWFPVGFAVWVMGVAVVLPWRFGRVQVVFDADGVGLAARPGGVPAPWFGWETIGRVEVVDGGRFWLVWTRAAGVYGLTRKGAVAALEGASKEVREWMVSRLPFEHVLVLRAGDLAGQDRARLVSAFATFGNIAGMPGGAA